MHEPLARQPGTTHEVELIETMDEMIDLVFRDIENARRRAWVAAYIVRDDKLGTELARRLAAARARGVDARLLFDALGSKETPDAFVRRVEETGVEVRRYRPLVASLLAGRFFPRDHGRAVVIDDHGYTSGAAWGDEWLPRRHGGEGWHDASARVTGPCVDELASMFDLRWKEAVSLSAPPERIDATCSYDDVEILADAPQNGLTILSRYVDRVKRARTRVWLENAYFFPPRSLLDALAAAAARGVDVRVVCPGKTDLPSVRWAARGEYESWIARGIRVFEFMPRILHSKAAVIDDDWATVGSLNLNVITLWVVNELNLVVHERAFCADVVRYFEHDLSRSKEILPGQTRRRSLLRHALCVILARAFRFWERVNERRLAKLAPPPAALPERRTS
jgi:cardiolipin synthase A/B